MNGALLGVLRARLPGAEDARVEVTLDAVRWPVCWVSSPHGRYDLCVAAARGGLRCDIVRHDARQMRMRVGVVWCARDGSVVRQEVHQRVVRGSWSWRAPALDGATVSVTVSEEPCVRRGRPA